MPDKYKWVIVAAEAWAGILAFLSLLTILFTTIKDEHDKPKQVLNFLYAVIVVIVASTLAITSYF